MSDPEQLADEQIVTAVLAGDRDRFALIVQRYHRALQQVAWNRLGHHAWAEDVVQEAFLAAFRSLGTYDSQYSFRTWLWTILLNQCNRAFAKQARRDAKTAQSHPAEGWEQALVDASSPTPPTEILVRDQSERLRAAMSELPRDQAEALELRFFGGLKFHEIAETVGCGLSTAKNRVRCGLQRLAERLPHEDRPSPANTLPPPTTEKPT